MKKLILILLLIPNLVMAETWVCSYLMNGEIQTSTFKRLSDKEFITTGGITDKLYYEEDKSITLTHSSGNIGFSSTILDKKHKRFITTNTTRVSKDGLKDNYTVYQWKGDCEVVE